MHILYANRILSDPKILGGKPVIKGTRISVAFLLELFQSGMTINDMLEEYPTLSRADIRSALAFARHAVTQESFVPFRLVHAR